MIENPQAFPIHFSVGSEGNDMGMTLRDYFAGQALIGLVANAKLHEANGTFSEQAYLYADSMLKARESKEKT